MKQFVLDRTGTNPVMDEVPTEKLPIYENESDLDADLSNLEDGAIVATNGGHDDVIDGMKTYIRNQNLLSNPKKCSYRDTYNGTTGISGMTGTNTEADPLVMPYDGFVNVYLSGGSGNVILNYIDENNQSQTWERLYANNGIAGGSCLPVKKGTKLWEYNYSIESWDIVYYVFQFYENRDYTGR